MSQPGGSDKWDDLWLMDDLRYRLTDANSHDLYIFDIDGTLIDRDTEILLPNVKKWFDDNIGNKKIAFATNQGGVGLRHWLGKIGHDKEYLPSEDQVIQKFKRLTRKLTLDIEQQHILFNNINVCYAYRNKYGEWYPIPKFADSYSWKPEFRKPSPGMLNRAMAHFLCKSNKTIMIGDREEDKEAANKAGCSFEYADVFFERSVSSRMRKL
jgi:HAD superfamily hydrolase (TIGR01662 family)